MSKRLLIIAAAGFALCALCFTLAFLVAGNRIFRNEKPFAAIRPLIDMATRKEWRWNGGDTLAVSAPMVLRYRQKGPANVTVTGPANLLDQVQVGGGQIVARDVAPRADDEKLEATISGVPIRKFVANGHQQLQLGHIDQESLDVRVNGGGGSASAEGKVGRLNLVISGHGNADFGRLVAQEAKVAIFGHGDAILAPQRSLFLTIIGHGTVRLRSHPANLEKTIIGSGRLIEADAAEPQLPAMPAMPAMPPVPPLPPLPSGGHAESSANAGRSFVVQGSGRTDLGHLEQGRVTVTLTGSGSASANGQVDLLSLTVGGSGSANLGALSARRVDVTVAGSGDATIAPQDEAHVTILGSGNVYLLSKPVRIEHTIIGSGRIVERY